MDRNVNDAKMMQECRKGHHTDGVYQLKTILAASVFDTTVGTLIRVLAPIARGMGCVMVDRGRRMRRVASTHCFPLRKKQMHWQFDPLLLKGRASSLEGRGCLYAQSIVDVCALRSLFGNSAYTGANLPVRCPIRQIDTLLVGHKIDNQ